jgi:hypothetical protein
MNYGWGLYARRARQIRNTKDMGQEKEPDLKNPREKSPAVSQEAKAREETEKLAAGEDPSDEKSKEAVEDHKDARKKIEKDFSSPEQMP